ncbi:hypothetical protein [Aeribacillus alveayuensis]|uniref:Uncharacterized protein n=1 Tax=Aeribacillus alveayuensis TaxID=279215 RepID=A0ABT9VSQ0_9BACI|nr:hypothetical protein [Bacillus alveayuensis]
MEQEQTIKNNSAIFQILAIGILFSLLLIITNNIRMTFNLSAMVGGLTYAAAFEGLRRAYKHYKDGKQIIRALRVAFSWNVVGLIISYAGEKAVAYVLEHHMSTLAFW